MEPFHPHWTPRQVAPFGVWMVSVPFGQWGSIWGLPVSTGQPLNAVHTGHVHVHRDR